MTDAFLAELRGSAPPAPERLRTRVEAIAAREPQPRASWREWIQLRRVLVIAVPAALAAMLAVAVGHGVFDAPAGHGNAVQGYSAAESAPVRGRSNGGGGAL